MAPFPSCPRAYLWDVDLEADTNLTWNLLFGEAQNQQTQEGRGTSEASLGTKLSLELGASCSIRL